MTDILNAEANATEKKPTTLAEIIESLSKFDQTSEFVAGIEGIGMTIPIVGAIQVNSNEGKVLTVIQLHGEGVVRALQHAQQMSLQENEVSN